MANNYKKHIAIVSVIKFAVVAVIIFVGSNFLVYSALLSAFQITSIHYQFLVGVIFCVLSGGFIVMLIAEKYSANILIRSLYVVTAVWMGMFVYLFFISILYDILKILLQNTGMVGESLFFIAFAAGVYGLVHAKKIFIKRVEVSISNLPQNWKGRSAVWMSDQHLGSIYRTRFMEKVTRTSNSLSPDIVFIGGDLYDGTHVFDPYILAQPLEKISSRLGVFYVTGNHEEFGNSGIFLEAIQKVGVTILNDEKIEIDGMQIVGVDYLNSSKTEQFKSVLEKINIDKTKPSILLKHEPRDLDTAEQSGISLQISGHTHYGQQWPFNHLVNYMYKGYAYGFKKHGMMQVFVSSGVGSWGPPIRVGSNSEIVYITFK